MRSAAVRQFPSQVGREKRKPIQSASITAADIARRFALSRSKAHELLVTEIKHYRFGRSIRTTEADLQDWLAAKRVGV